MPLIRAAEQVSRRVSEFEVPPPYIADTEVFWKRSDLYVMKAETQPADRWPDEVVHPGAHGIRVIVLLPGDYRKRSDGRLPDGVLYIAESGTREQPLLVTYAPAVGTDIMDAPHPAQRFGKSEAQLTSVRVWNQNYQYFHGLTFANGVSACFMRETTGSVFDRCLWHETAAQPMRIRFGAHHNVVQRCVMRRFKKEQWGHGDTVAINLSDGACTHNHFISNVILNYSDGYQHTDREGDAYGLGAGTIIDNNFIGFTRDAYTQETSGELMCGENALDFKMGGTAEEPIRVTQNIFFGVRAAKRGCAASGSGGYAVTFHRRGTWVELSRNLFIDNDSGIFLNAFFRDTHPAAGRIDPHLTITHNMFSGVTSYATAFPNHTGRVLSGVSAANFSFNQVIRSEHLMKQEPLPGTGILTIQNNRFYGSIDPAPRDRTRLFADDNQFHDASETRPVTLSIPWTNRTLEYAAPAK